MIDFRAEALKAQLSEELVDRLFPFLEKAQLLNPSLAFQDIQVN